MLNDPNMIEEIENNISALTTKVETAQTAASEADTKAVAAQETANQADIKAWEEEYEKQRLIQWPSAWADTMLEARKK